MDMTTDQDSPKQPEGLNGRSNWRSKSVISLLEFMPRVMPGLWKRFQRRLYNRFSRRTQWEGVTLMNYGYASPDPFILGVELDAAREVHRQSLQLYHRVAGAVDLLGKDVLEVGSGRGGGAAYVVEAFKPRSFTGADFSEVAVEFCRNHYKAEGLSFVWGDAEKLPFPDESFDAVMNIESAHCYGSLERFLAEVYRVLRPQGHLLFTDLMPSERVGTLRSLLGRLGFTVVEEEDITPNVLLALELASDGKLTAIRANTPKLLQPFLACIAGTKGSSLYNSLQSGTMAYPRFVAQKTNAER